ncbi:MAG: hypothetical protein JNJ70_15700 [Verrucomicrobiales bacterium]|nr:hypothetical protein [Verrucomicrobiales bacterium]
MRTAIAGLLGGALLLSSCARRGGEDTFAGLVAESALLAEVRETTRSEGLVAAKRKLEAGLVAEDQSSGLLERRVIRTTGDAGFAFPDSLAAMTAGERARTAIVIVPGTRAGNPNKKDRTRECLRGAAEAARGMGFSTWFIETEARGSVEENAAFIAAQLQQAFARSEKVILVMLSKGAHDVIHYLQEDGIHLPASDRRKLAVVLSLAGTVQGSVVGDWMAHSSRPFPTMTRRWLRVSDQEKAIAMLESIARSPWEADAARFAARFPGTTWISIAMIPDGADGRITERLWSPGVRRQVERTAPYYSPSDGLVESAASVLPDRVTLPEWVVVGYGSHAMPNGSYRDGTRIAPQTTRPGHEKLRPESGGEIMSAYLRALPRSLLH